jgi:hypothetical protein
MRLSGDTLWLGVTGLVGAAIIAILYWPISAVLSPRLLAGATAVSTTARAAPETAPSPVGLTLASVYCASRIAPPIAPLTTMEGSGEPASYVASITSIMAPTQPNDSELSPLDPNVDRPPAKSLTDRAKLTTASRAPQQSQWATAPSPRSHQLGSPRARRPHQQAPAGRSQKSEPEPR